MMPYNTSRHGSSNLCQERSPPPPDDNNSFQFFAQLPPELQIQIWEAVDSDPNIISIKRNANCRPTNNILRVDVSYSVPSLLRTCHMSRTVALPQYNLCFKDQLERPIYFNATKDIIYLDDCETVACFLQTPFFTPVVMKFEDLGRIRCLSIGGPWYASQNKFLQRLYLFTGLEELWFEGIKKNFRREDNFKRRLETQWAQHQAYRTTVLKEETDGKSPKITFI